MLIDENLIYLPSIQGGPEKLLFKQFDYFVVNDFSVKINHHVR